MVQTIEEKREYRKQYREKNKEKIKAYVQKWREENPEYMKEYNKKWHKENHMKRTISQWKSNGLIVDDNDEYESIYYLVQSAEYCELCNCKLTENQPQTSTSRCMDHDHFTGKFRNLVCRSCNAILPTQKVIKL